MCCELGADVECLHTVDLTSFSSSVGGISCARVTRLIIAVSCRHCRTCLARSASNALFIYVLIDMSVSFHSVCCDFVTFTDKRYMYVFTSR